MSIGQEHRDNRRSAGPVRIDIGAINELAEAPLPTLPSVPADSFVNWIFVEDWNAFIYAAAQDAKLTWLP